MDSGGSTQSTHNESSAQPIAPIRLVMTLLGPLILIILSRYLELGLERKVFLGIFRSSVQLLFLGFVLLGFIFSLNNPLVVFGYLTMMILIAALEATGRQARTYQGHYLDCLISSMVGGGFVGIYGSAVIFHPHPWWSPAVLIPTSGMIIGNSVSGPAVAVERLLSEVADKKHEAETRLAFGASDYESVLGIVKASISAALLPTMNQMAIMGLVSIPGMMTGQLIGGTSPAVAAEYQMAILYLLVTTATISSFTSVLLAVRHAVFDREHRMTPEKLIKTGKVEIDQAIYRLVTQFLTFLHRLPIHCEGIATCFLSLCSASTTTATTTATAILTRPKYAALSDQSSHDSNDSLLIQNNSNNNNDKQVELTSALHTQSNASPFIIESSEHDDDIEENTHQHNNNNHEHRQFDVFHARDFAEDGLEGRVSYEYLTNSPIYTPTTPLSNNNHNDRSQQNSSAVGYYPFFTAHHINVKSGEGKLFTHTGLHLCVHRGERVTLEGPSGIGKTRLLRALAELDPLYTGVVTMLGGTTQHFLRNGTSKLGNTTASTGTNASNTSTNTKGSILNITNKQNMVVLQRSLSRHPWYRNNSDNSTDNKFQLRLLTVPQWRARVIYVPQALPPLAGTPLSLMKEACQYRSRRQYAPVESVRTDLERQCGRLELSLGLRAGLLSAAWNTLSGGERQRAAIACALLLATIMPPLRTTTNSSSHEQGGSDSSSSAASSNSSSEREGYQQQEVNAQHYYPDTLLLLDEPTAACDPETTLLVEQALVASGAALIVITHDERQAKRLAHRRLILTSSKQ